MAFFKVLLSKRAERDFDDLRTDEKLFLEREIRLLESSPFPFKKKIKRIKGTSSALYRLRADLSSQSFRVFYSIIEPDTVIILRIVPKKEADRVLSKII